MRGRMLTTTQGVECYRLAPMISTPKRYMGQEARGISHLCGSILDGKDQQRLVGIVHKFVDPGNVAVHPCPEAGNSCRDRLGTKAESDAGAERSAGAEAGQMQEQGRGPCPVGKSAASEALQISSSRCTPRTAPANHPPGHEGVQGAPVSRNRRHLLLTFRLFRRRRLLFRQFRAGPVILHRHVVRPVAVVIAKALIEPLLLLSCCFWCWCCELQGWSRVNPRTGCCRRRRCCWCCCWWLLLLLLLFLRV